MEWSLMRLAIPEGLAFEALTLTLRALRARAAELDRAMHPERGSSG
jgi:hypothetical protein